MYERQDERPDSPRWIRAVAVVATAVAVASSAIVGTVAAQTGPLFNDVPFGHWAYEPVQWAVQNGITQGCGDGRNFCPDQTLTRAHMVTFLKRYHEKFGGGSSAGSGGTSGSSGSSSDIEYTLREYGSDEDSVSLPEGSYRVEFLLEHDRALSDDFARVELRAEDSHGRSEVLVDVEPSKDDTSRSLHARETIVVGTRLGELEPGRIYFEVSLFPEAGQPSRAIWAEWEIVIYER